MNIRLRISFLLILGLLGRVLSGQEPPVPAVEDELYPEFPSESQRIREIRQEWELQAIEQAIQSGFYGVADTLSKRLGRDQLSPERLERLFNFRFQIALVRGNLGEASSLRQQMLERNLDAHPLLAAFLTFFRDPEAPGSTLLENLEDLNFSLEERAWKRLLEALILARNNQTEAANEAFMLAERMAPSPLLRDHFEIIRLREELTSGSIDQESISGLREAVRSMQGERGGFEAARLLAIALNRNGNQAEAIEVLNAQLAFPGLEEYGLRADFLLLLGLIAGPDSLRGNLALRQLVSEVNGDEMPALGLTLLVQAVSTPDQLESLLQDIETWLERDSPHPLSDQLLAYEAFLRLENGNLEAAEEQAQALLDRYPNSPYLKSALHILAYTAWNQDPPRYRTAAGYLNRLRQQLQDSREILVTGILIADCYFLNGDYTSASDAYGAVLRDAPKELAPGIFFQKVLSEIQGGRPAEAARQIDMAYGDARLDPVSIWMAEWNFLDHLRREGRIQDALARVQLLMSRPEPTGVDDALLLRMRWISARLNLEAGNAEEALVQAETLLNELIQSAFDNLPGQLLSEVESHLLLLVGEAHFASGDKTAGLNTFARLREQYPQSGPSILSYLVESRSESVGDNLVSAQRSLIDLVDRFPKSEFAPIALWEAALNSEQRGLNVHLQEAISILERLATDYPQHPLVYYARLKQGDLARRLNDFPTALLLYERLLSLYPGHPERYRAEISRADCLMALGSEDPSRFDVAALIYERNCLLSGAPLPIRLEAGFKWANSLRQQGDPLGSESVFWLLYERFILDPDMNQLILTQQAGRYWMSRVLLEMASQQSEKGELASAITLYQTHLSLDLPGAGLVETRLEALR